MSSGGQGAPEGEKDANYLITSKSNAARVLGEDKVRKEDPAKHVVKVNGTVVRPVVDEGEFVARVVGNQLPRKKFVARNRAGSSFDWQDLEGEAFGGGKGAAPMDKVGNVAHDPQQNASSKDGRFSGRLSKNGGMTLEEIYERLVVARKIYERLLEADAGQFHSEGRIGQKTMRLDRAQQADEAHLRLPDAFRLYYKGRDARERVPPGDVSSPRKETPVRAARKVVFERCASHGLTTALPHLLA